MKENQTTKVFVAGATGYVGQAVVRRLRELDIPTVAHVRPDSARLTHWRDAFGALGAEVDATPWSAAEMGSMFAARRPSVIFILLGTTRKRMQQPGVKREETDYMAVDYGLTKTVVDAAHRAGIKPRLVYLSAIGASPRSHTAYGKARYLAERTVIEAGMPYTIAQPSFITGKDRDEKRSSEYYGAKLIDGALAVVGSFGAQLLREKYRSTTATRLARRLVELAFDPVAADSVFTSDQLQD